MQNANIGLVDITLTCHFEVKDAEVFGGAGSVGYTSVALKHAKAAKRVFLKADANPENEKYRANSLLTRLGLAPALLFLMAYFLPVDDYIKRVIIIQAAIPSAVIPVILAKRFGGHPDLGTQILLTTTVASFLTLPCWLTLGSILVVPLY